MKRIVTITPNFFDYQDILNKTLENYFNEVLNYDLFLPTRYSFIKRKLLHYFFKDFYNSLKEEYYQKIINDLKGYSIQRMLIIKVEDIPLKFLEKIRTELNIEKIILFEWDDIKNNKKILEKIIFFDDVFTYNILDSNYYKLKHISIFFKKYKITQESKINDLYFLGSYNRKHNERFEIIKKIDELYNGKYRLNLNLYSSRIRFLFNYLTKKIKTNDISYFKFKSVPYSKMIEEIQKSICVIDLKGDNQEGLTTRIIEALASKTKIITNNTNVKKYDFYDENNIFVFKSIEQLNSIEFEKFIKTSFNLEKEEFVNRLEINNWLKEINII